MDTKGLGHRWLIAIALAALVAVWSGFSLRPDPGPSDAANLNFTLKDASGADVRLADYRGRPLILNFWATWCGPCRAEIPALVDLAAAYRSRHLTVLGISVDDRPEDLRRFAAEYKMNYPVLVGLGHDELQEAYDALIAIPVTWFIRADGTIHAKHQGPATKAYLEAQIKAMVGEAEAR